MENTTQTRQHTICIPAQDNAASRPPNPQAASLCGLFRVLEVPQHRPRLFVVRGQPQRVLDALKRRFKQAGTHYKAYIYEGAEHGFNNDTTPRFDKAAADLAWARTLALLRQTIS
jgi:acetyl esterase/lipase